MKQKAQMSAAFYRWFKTLPKREQQKVLAIINAGYKGEWNDKTNSPVLKRQK